MEDFLQWFVAFRSPKDIWNNHPTYLTLEITTYLLTALNLRHAIRNGGRYIYLWFTTILHGIVVECLSYFLQDIDSFWHGQSMVMFVGKRFPLHIVLFYPYFLYTAAASISKMNLKKYAEPFAMGLAVVLLDVPFDIMGIKLLWWTWHDTDPNIYDRHYWVPWTSYYFHATFACSFWFLFFGTRSLFCNTKTKFQSDGVFKELLCSLITGLFAMPLGVLQFLPIYHTLHDVYGIHTEVPVLIILTIYGLIWWTADRRPEKESRATNAKGLFDELSFLVLVHFILYILLVMFAKPENQVSIGLHEQTGDCNSVSEVQTASGMILKKKTYLCTNNYSEGYYDWHCVDNKRPRDGLEWYTVCGTPYPNHMEYIVVVAAFSLLGLFIYLQMLWYSGKHPPSRAPAKDSQGQKAAKSGSKQKRH